MVFMVTCQAMTPGLGASMTPGLASMTPGMGGWGGGATRQALRKTEKTCGKMMKCVESKLMNMDVQNGKNDVL